MFQEFEPEGLDSLISIIKQLATDSNKSRSKKDRKEQRLNFRDILKGVEDGDPPAEKVKFGQEVLMLDYWYKKIQYDWFCKVTFKNMSAHFHKPFRHVQVLGFGTNHHLSTNYMLREVFELGPPLPIFDVNAKSRQTKTQRVTIYLPTYLPTNTDLS